MPNRLVIIPTYNERENIAQILKKVFSLPEDFDVLVVDDNSPDGTAQIVKSLMQEFTEKLFMLERPAKMGLGTAYIAGFDWALERGYKYMFEMDADFSHDPQDLLRLHAACANSGTDVCVGSRYVKGGKVINWPWRRLLLSYFASIYVRILTRLPLKDATAGFVCYKREVLENIRFREIQFVGYAFQIEMKYRCWKRGFVIREIPISFTERTQGKSKMSQVILREAIIGVLRLRNQDTE